MYKVLIADDEEIIRRGISRLISKDCDCDIVAEAEDGEMAYEMAIEHRPDLLFVDINMPFLSGFEFIEKIRSKLPDSLITIITGFDDFKHAHKALQLQLFDYIVKPLSEPVFFESLDRSKKELEKLKENKNYKTWAEKQFSKNKKKINSVFFSNWVNGKINGEQIDEEIRYLSLSLPQQNICIAVIHAHHKNPVQLINDKWEDEDIHYAVCNFAKDIFEQYSSLNIFSDESGDIAIICKSDDFNKFNETVLNFEKEITNWLPFEIEFSLGSCKNFSDIPSTFLLAKRKLNKNINFSHLIKTAISTIEAKYGDAEFSLQELAEIAFVSSQHLSREFKKETGITFIDYLTRVRIKNAAKLLLNENMKIYEVAEKTGYSNQHYFSSAFKKTLGISPAEYRRKTFKKQDEGTP